ncbi:proton-coupled folate transporter-like [Saccostrea echinata]|uniref:proton-coupled folate transporter-like n=1 Tax=Saccostrea echinata TaxID=191078 RepID=UPI002A7F8465|nr:proton-coupled folate transporter-like [Saccostrea echinata]
MLVINEKNVKSKSTDNDETKITDSTHLLHSEDTETVRLLGESTQDTVKSPGPRHFFRHSFVLSLGIFLLVIAFTITQHGVLNQYVYFYFHKHYFGNLSFQVNPTEKSYCKANNVSSDITEAENKIQVLASQFLIYTSLALFIPPVLGNLFFATLSDTYGRKPFIVLPIAGAFLRYVLFVIGIHYEVNLYWLIVFLLVEGATGGLFSLLSVALSYVADITEPGDNRVFLLVIIEVCAGVGGLVGSLSSGYLIRALGFTISTLISTICVFLSVLIIGLFLPESLPHEVKLISKRLQICDKLKGVTTFYTSNRYGKGTQWRYVFSILVGICVQLGLQGKASVETLYQLNAPFCWDSVLIGWFIAIRITFAYIVGLVLLRLLQRCISIEFCGVIGAASHASSFFLEAFAEKSFEMFFVPVVGFGSAMIGPIMKGFMSKMTPADKQGTLFAGIGMADSLCNIIGITVGNAVYSATVAKMRGFVFLMFAGISTVAVILIFILWLAGRIGGSKDMTYTEKEIVVDPEEK